ncbi:MAG: cyclase family protein [Dehalococcoidia bacterium]|nr:cyclase family protein [Dehalococcoidia bacterium]
MECRSVKVMRTTTPLTQRAVRSQAGAASSRWIDISVALQDGMAHWPTDPPVRIQRVLDMERGDSHTLSLLSMGSHSGTHIDAPLHFVKQGRSIDQLSPDILIGRARVIEICDGESIKPVELAQYDIRRGERLLFKTRNSSRVWQSDRFIEDFVFLSEAAASLLAERRVRLVGIDYLSIGGFKRDGGRVHRLLLEAGVWIIEGLDLSGAEPGGYELVCLPIKLSGGDGASARAIIRPARRG